MSAIAEVTFLVEISLAALALIAILNVVVLFMITGLSGKLTRQNDHFFTCSGHKRCISTERNASFK